MEPLDLIQVGTAALARNGEEGSGDRLLVKGFQGGALVAVVDGLGHGREAGAAAQLAVAILNKRPGGPLATLLRTCHEALRSTRGAVISLASFNEAEARMTWAGVGNVEGVLLRADPRGRRQESLLLRGGVVGGQLPSLHESCLALGKGDVLILATDGIDGSFSQDLSPRDPPQRMAEQILSRYGKKSDDALVLVARYTGKNRQ
jgi:phosphoserine phosphatase RsbX